MLDATVNKSGGKSLMPPPADTLEFAQSRRAACAPQDPPPGLPPTSADSSSADVDPLDTNEDGTVSAQERAPGELAEAMKDLLKEYAEAATDSAAARRGGQLERGGVSLHLSPPAQPGPSGVRLMLLCLAPAHGKLLDTPPRSNRATGPTFDTATAAGRTGSARASSTLMREALDPAEPEAHSRLVPRAPHG